MRLHRFYIATPISEEKFDVADADLISQWRNVFRYNVGSQVILFDGTGTDFLCIITMLRNSGATVEVFQKKKNKHTPKINLCLCVAVIKKDNFEWVVQKATELGVSAIVPVLCERTEKKNVNMERLQKIAVEASEQSGRGDIPKINDVAELSDLLASETLPKEKIVLHLDGEYIGDFLAHTQPKSLAIFLGPEGGFSEVEIKDFAKQKIPTISLGTQILRAETAAIAVSSLLLL